VIYKHVMDKFSIL